MLKTFLTLSLCMACIGSVRAEESEREPFDDRYCTTCHGTEGRGNEGVQAPRLAGMEPWYLRRQLENFRGDIRGVHPEDKEGIAMRPMAMKLTDESIADIIDWISGWEYVPAEATIADGDPLRGRGLYSGCAVCHGADAEGNESLGAPALVGQNDWYLVTQLKNFLAGYRGMHPNDTYGAQMRTMVNTLRNEAGILNVVSYINTLSR